MFWKIQDISYEMGTEIFKIEGEMTEKMKPQVVNPPSVKRAEFSAHNTHSLILLAILQGIRVRTGSFSTLFILKINK